MISVRFFQFCLVTGTVKLRPVFCSSAWEPKRWCLAAKVPVCSHWEPFPSSLICLLFPREGLCCKRRRGRPQREYSPIFYWQYQKRLRRCFNTSNTCEGKRETRLLWSTFWVLQCWCTTEPFNLLSEQSVSNRHNYLGHITPGTKNRIPTPGSNTLKTKLLDKG